MSTGLPPCERSDAGQGGVQLGLGDFGGEDDLLHGGGVLTMRVVVERGEEEPEALTRNRWSWMVEGTETGVSSRQTSFSS